MHKSTKKSQASSAASELPIAREMAKIISPMYIGKITTILNDILPIFSRFVKERDSFVKRKFDNLYMLNKAEAFTKAIIQLENDIKNPTETKIISSIRILRPYADDFRSLADNEHKVAFSIYPEVLKLLKNLYGAISFKLIKAYDEFITMHYPEEKNEFLADAYSIKGHKYLAGIGIDTDLSDEQRIKAFETSLEYRKQVRDPSDPQNVKNYADTLFELSSYAKYFPEKLVYIREVQKLNLDSRMQAKVKINLFEVLLGKDLELQQDNLKELLSISHDPILPHAVQILMSVLIDYIYSLENIANHLEKLDDAKKEFEKYTISEDKDSTKAIYMEFLTYRFNCFILDLHSDHFPDGDKSSQAFYELRSVRALDTHLLNQMQHCVLRAYILSSNFAAAQKFLTKEKIKVLKTDFLPFKFRALDIYKALNETKKVKEIESSINKILGQTEKQDPQEVAEQADNAIIVQETKKDGTSVSIDTTIVVEPIEKLSPISKPLPKTKFTQLDFARVEASDPTDVTQEEYKKYWEFKKKKEQYSKESVEAYSAPVQDVNWQIEGNTYIYCEENKKIVKLGTDLYAAISYEVYELLDELTTRRFEIALEHGIAKRKLGVNGIKTYGSIAELKINDDIRLYTQETYNNPDGKCLILFDKKGDHDDVTRASLSANKMSEVQVSFVLNKTDFIYPKFQDSMETEVATHDEPIGAAAENFHEDLI